MGWALRDLLGPVLSNQHLPVSPGQLNDIAFAIARQINTIHHFSTSANLTVKRNSMTGAVLLALTGQDR